MFYQVDGTLDSSSEVENPLAAVPKPKEQSFLLWDFLAALPALHLPLVVVTEWVRQSYFTIWTQRNYFWALGPIQIFWRQIQIAMQGGGGGAKLPPFSKI